MKCMAHTTCQSFTCETTYAAYLSVFELGSKIQQWVMSMAIGPYIALMSIVHDTVVLNTPLKSCDGVSDIVN